MYEIKIRKLVRYAINFESNKTLKALPRSNLNIRTLETANKTYVIEIRRKIILKTN